MGRRGVGIELKPTYFRQACRNLENATTGGTEEATLFTDTPQAIEPTA